MLLKLAYIGLTLLMILILIFIASKAINKTFSEKSIVTKKISTVIISLLLWQLFIFIMAASGMLQNFDFPPRFVIFLIFPSFLFTGIFIYRNRNNKWIQNIPAHWLIYYQSFRVLVESLFVFTVAKEILHPNVTIEGYNYDMLFAFTAPVIAFLLSRKKDLAKKIALVWNFIGLAVIAVIIFLFISTIYFPEFYGSETELMPTEITLYPYILVAGFLMPSAVFIHVLSIVQLKKQINV